MQGMDIVEFRVGKLWLQRERAFETPWRVLLLSCLDAVLFCGVNLTDLGVTALSG